MAATFSWVQYTGSNAQVTAFNGSSLTPTSSAAAMSWDFETADNVGTQAYTANPVSAGSASWPVWLKGYWTNSVGFTVSNFKFWQFNPASNSGNTASFTTFGTVQNTYSVASLAGTTTGSNFASNVSVATNGTNSTASPAGALIPTGSFTATAAASGVMPQYIALQLSAAAAAPAGTTGYFGYTLQYDEQ